MGAKRALKPKQIWEIRFYLNQRRRLRDRALFDLAIDSKLRGCDLVQIKIGDIVNGGQIRTRAIVMQQKTGRPVQFELLPDARASLLVWLDRRGGTVDDYVFPSRVDHNGHLSTLAGARIDYHRENHRDIHRDGASLDGVIELNGEWEGRQNKGGTIDITSGGKALNLSPGLRLTTGGWSFAFGVSVPVAQDIALSHSPTRYRARFAIGRTL